MNTNITIFECYQILDIKEDISYQELKKIYRRQLQKWHPDKVQYNKINPVEAEVRFKELQQAFEFLEDYYRKHEKLPSIRQDLISLDEILVTEKGPITQSSYQTSNINSSPIKVQSGGGFYKFIMILGVIVFFVAISVMFFGYDANEEDAAFFANNIKPNISSPIDVLEENTLAKPKKFTYGSSVGLVTDAQGIPTKVEKNIWYYGDSYVVFENGVVKEWSNSLANPLNVEMHTPSLAHETKEILIPTKIKVGSTKAEVKTLQGEPMQDLGDVWVYGTSKIYFKNDKVVSWVSSTLNPLKIK